MNFDEAFKHYRDGVATEEEKQFVKEQLAKANEFCKTSPCARNRRLRKRTRKT